MRYESYKTLESRVAPEVRFRIARISFERRLELLRRVRDLARRSEFFAAGEDAREKIEGALLAAEIDRVFLLWGVQEIEGLELDGAPATPEALAALGPENLFREAVDAVKGECGLTEEERKN